LLPPRKPCPLLLPRRFSPGRGLLLSWALRPFGHSLREHPTRSISLQVTPFVLSMNRPHGRPIAEP
jgi:hypothetical protein